MKNERLDDQQRDDKSGDGWELYCDIYREFFPNKAMAELSPAVLTEMAERLRTRSAGTRTSYKGWTFEPINAERDAPPQPHEMTKFWGKVKDADGRHISHIGQADAERLLGVQSASAASFDGPHFAATLREVAHHLHDAGMDEDGHKLEDIADAREAAWNATNSPTDRNANK